MCSNLVQRKRVQMLWNNLERLNQCIENVGKIFFRTNCTKILFLPNFAGGHFWVHIPHLKKFCKENNPWNTSCYKISAIIRNGLSIHPSHPEPNSKICFKTLSKATQNINFNLLSFDFLKQAISYIFRLKTPHPQTIFHASAEKKNKTDLWRTISSFFYKNQYI